MGRGGIRAREHESTVRALTARVTIPVYMVAVECSSDDPCRGGFAAPMLTIEEVAMRVFTGYDAPTNGSEFWLAIEFSESVRAVSGVK